MLLHHPKYLYVISFPGSTSKDLGGGASVLILTLALPRRRTECRSTTWLCLVVMVPAPACAQMRASLLHCVIARALRSPEKGDQSGSLCGPRRLRPATSRYRTCSLPVALSYVDLHSHARECLTPRVYVALQSNAISHVA